MTPGCWCSTPPPTPQPPPTTTTQHYREAIRKHVGFFCLLYAARKNERITERPSSVIKKYETPRSETRDTAETDETTPHPAIGVHSIQFIPFGTKQKGSLYD